MSAKPAIRRLGVGDEKVLQLLANDDVDFDLVDRHQSRSPLSPAEALSYLTNHDVLHWIAEQDGRITGQLNAQVIHKRAGDPTEVLFYEIGVRAKYRRTGVGRALVAVLLDWMRTHGVRDVWVLADSEGAVAFYQACGFTAETPAPVYMTYSLPKRGK